MMSDGTAKANPEEAAQLSISRVQSSTDDDFISVEIRTAAEVMYVELSLADFARALTGRGMVAAGLRRRKRIVR